MTTLPVQVISEQCKFTPFIDMHAAIILLHTDGHPEVIRQGRGQCNVLGYFLTHWDCGMCCSVSLGQRQNEYAVVISPLPCAGYNGSVAWDTYLVDLNCFPLIMYSYLFHYIYWVYNISLQG